MIFFARKSVQFIVTLFILLAISALPSLIVELKFVPMNYWDALLQQFHQLSQLDEITYYNRTSQQVLPLLPDLAPFIRETLIIFATALIVSTLIALFYAYFFYRSGKLVRNVLQTICQTLEMVPDLFWLVFLQFLALTLNRTNRFARIEIAGGFAEYIRLLPILTLTMTILFFFIKWLTIHVLEQETTPFLELARAKGVRPTSIFWKHLLPNLVYRFYLFFRSNMITILSSLLIVEYLYNVQGLFRFAVINPQMEILLVILFIIYIPIFLLDLVIEWLIPNAWKGGV